MGKYVFIIAAIVGAGLFFGGIHYYTAAPNHIYSGESVLMNQTGYHNFINATERPGVELLSIETVMNTGDRSAVNFRVRVDSPPFEYGEYQGNLTSKHAKTIAIATIVSIFSIFIIFIVVRKFGIGPRETDWFDGDIRL